MPKPFHDNLELKKTIWHPFHWFLQQTAFDNRSTTEIYRALNECVIQKNRWALKENNTKKLTFPKYKLYIFSFVVTVESYL